MSTKKKRRRPRVADDDIAFSQAQTYVARMSARGDAAFRRAVDRLQRELTRTPANPARVAAAERLVFEAREQSRSLGLLVTELRDTLELAKAKVAMVEAEAALKMLLAVSRHHDRALSRARATPNTVRPARRGRDKRTTAMLLDEAKYATAIVIADRNRMREQLVQMEAASASPETISAWRRELVIQEATIEALKAGLRVIRDAAGSKP